MDHRPLLDDVGVIALVPNLWRDAWQPRHHVLARLARFFRVVWVTPAPSWRSVLRHPGRYRVANPAPVPGLTIHSPDRLYPRFHRPGWLADWAQARRIAGARRKLLQSGCTRTVLYVWRPDYAAALSAVPYDVCCYHIDDEYSFSDEVQPISDQEMRLLVEADQVFIHSPQLMERKGGYNPHTAYIPNGVDYDAFARAVDEPEDLRSIPRPRIGYAGWLKKQLDWRLIDQLVRRHPEWSFVFVGGRKNVAEIAPALDALSGRPNVHFLGHRPISTLGAYPQHFDVCILPYVSNYYTNCIHPMKLHEYLASGRPAVGTPIRSLLPYGHVVALPGSPDEWSRELAHALSAEADAPDLRARRQRIAREHDWGTLTSRIAGLMAERLGGDVEARFHRLAPAGPVPAAGPPVVEMPETR